MSEEFRPIPGFEGRYEVSSLGRVRALGKPKTFRQRYGGEWKIVTRGRQDVIMSPHETWDSYLRVTLSPETGKPRHYSIHVLVAMAFHPNPNGLPEVAHIDHNRQNNRPENLKWASRSGNHSDSVIENRYALAGPNTGRKRTFTADEVRAIRQRFADGEKQSEIARSLGVRQEQIRKIISRERWSHV